jgi:para-aminobenzoate synthetase
MAVRTLLIDNYDSFTYNLFQLLAEANGEDPVVVRNDEASWPELAQAGFDNVVISPGPGRPERERDFGLCAEAISESELPLLGVCLGHQGIGALCGAPVVHAPEVMHGRLSAVYHDGSPLFAEIPQGFQAVRYHSLCLARPLPAELDAIAWTGDGVVMAVAHRSKPQWGVQFHPESILTSHGRRLLANFRYLTALTGRGGSAAERSRPAGRHRRAAPAPSPAGKPQALRLEVERLDRVCDPEQAFAELFGDRSHAFWLDSSRLDERSRFSFIGDAGGPLGAVIDYDVAARQVRVTRGGSVEVHDETIFDYLNRELARLRLPSDELPFDLNCGFVGYFGYELKADCGGDLVHESPLPDVALILAGRLVAFDHAEQATYVVCLSTPESRAEATAWVRNVSRTLSAISEPASRAAPAGANGPSRSPGFQLSRSHEHYLEDIRRCKQYLHDGETYEVCLTNKLRTEPAGEPLSLYGTLRRINPAPFAALLRCGEVSVLSSSPERFLSIGRDRWVEAKPIKGTAPRGRTPDEDRRLSAGLRASEKNRAENLMITDLLRNDLGRVCEIGTVHVPHLMEIESYETVHQLVSTVRGRLRDGVGAADCIRACFPAGSMTGAPKKRTMEIIDELEQEPRGVYSGAIGYLGLGGGCDLNVVIRTIVSDGVTTTIGAGGAIVAQSDPEDEYQEMLLKARALMHAIETSPAPGAARAGALSQPPA